MMYDALLLIAVLFFAGFVFIYVTDYPHHPNLRPLLQLFLLSVIVGYFCFFWCKTGQTLAMKTWRIKLENSEGKLLSPVQSLTRFALALLGVGCGGIAILWAFVDRDKQFLYDRLTRNRLISVASQ